MVDERGRLCRGKPDATHTRHFDVIDEPAHDARRPVVGQRDLHLLIDSARDRREHGRKRCIARRTTQLQPLVIRIDRVVRQPGVEDHASFRVQNIHRETSEPQVRVRVCHGVAEWMRPGAECPTARPHVDLQLLTGDRVEAWHGVRRKMLRIGHPLNVIVLAGRDLCECRLATQRVRPRCPYVEALV